ncbi:MAG: hypothetical protein GX175_11770, partial [Halanaerobiaceae bacterium]|nr:hypothetical protein [Halanaerobiaceae bacterium]
SGKYDVKQWYKHTSGAFNTQSGYLAIPQAGGYGDTGLRTCVKVKNVVRTENGFKVEVYELECDYYGRAIYDNANNICISSSVAEWNASFDDMLKSSGVSLNKLGTKTYNLGVSDNEIYLIA